MPREVFDPFAVERTQQIAGALIDCLEGPLPVKSRQQWRAEDHYGIAAVALLDRSIASGRLDEEVESGAERLMIGDELQIFHSALPFARAERQLIGEAYAPELMPEDQRDKMIKIIPSRSICVEGIFRVTSGRDLMSRWWTWRRQTGDYHQSGSLDLARTWIGRVYSDLSEINRRR